MRNKADRRYKELSVDLTNHQQRDKLFFRDPLKQMCSGPEGQVVAVRPPMRALGLVVLAGIFANFGLPISADSVDQQIRMALAIYSRMIVELSDAGYSEIRMLDWQKNRLIALDQYGSRVIIVLNPNATQVRSMEYIHMADR